MSTTTEPSTLVDLVLIDVNELRDQYDLEPLRWLPQGRLHSPKECPVARALNASHVGFTSIQISGEVYPTPLNIALFVSSFDDGRFPDLIER